MEVSKFHFDAIYSRSMTFDFVSWSVLYWQIKSLFTSRIGQQWSHARLNDVRGISMLSAGIEERQNQVTSRYASFYVINRMFKKCSNNWNSISFTNFDFLK